MKSRFRRFAAREWTLWESNPHWMEPKSIASAYWAKRPMLPSARASLPGRESYENLATFPWLALSAQLVHALRLRDYLGCYRMGLQGQDLNLRPPGYEPVELPDCSSLLFCCPLCRPPGAWRMNHQLPKPRTERPAYPVAGRKLQAKRSSRAEQSADSSAFHQCNQNERKQHAEE